MAEHNSKRRNKVESERDGLHVDSNILQVYSSILHCMSDCLLSFHTNTMSQYHVSIPCLPSLHANNRYGQEKAKRNTSLKSKRAAGWHLATCSSLMISRSLSLSLSATLCLPRCLPRCLSCHCLCLQVSTCVCCLGLSLCILSMPTCV